MAKAHFEQPNTSKGRAATQERDLKPGKPEHPTPRDQDWFRYAQEKAGVGFSGNPVDVLVRGDNPAAGEYRRPKEHSYQVPSGAGAGSADARIQQQNRLGSGKRK